MERKLVPHTHFYVMIIAILFAKVGDAQLYVTVTSILQKKGGTKKIPVFELKTSTVSRQAAKGLSIINTSFFEIAYININMYIQWSSSMNNLFRCCGSDLVGFRCKKRERGRRRGELRGRLVDANA